MQKRIYYYDTDCGGVVYYANYLKYLEEARTEFLDERGISIQELTKHGTLFAVARQEIDYKAPAFYGDVLDVRAKLTNISSVKLEYAQEIKNQHGKTICVAKTILACVDKNLKPKPIPEEIRKQLTV